MMDYSPMNNVQTGNNNYPSCWITGGLYDPHVAYWEPSKFAATLRHANPDNENPICMKVDLSSGHFSASDRYKYYRELARDYSFLSDQLGLAKGDGGLNPSSLRPSRIVCLREEVSGWVGDL